MPETIIESPQESVSEASNQAGGECIFPLPLEPYERYMLADDKPDYPMVFVIAVELSGTLRRPEFETSLQTALERHPLLRCRVEWIRDREWCWTPVDSLVPQLDWSRGCGSLDATRAQPIDLTREIGMRVAVCQTSNRAHVSFQFHHAATDGIGGMQFIGDVLGVYGQMTAAPGDEIPELEPLRLQLLAERGRLRFDGAAPRRGFLARTASRVLSMLRQIPSPLAVPGPSSAGQISRRQSFRPRVANQHFPAFVSRSLPREILQGLKKQAAAKMVTVNDLLVLDMFRTIRDWNRVCGRRDNRAWYRIGIPISLRTPLEDELPAANVVSFLFITRRARDCNREDELLQFIHRETEAVNQGNNRLIFALALSKVLKIPGLLAGLLRVPVCQATAILANVGDVRRQFRVRFPLKHGRCVAGNVTLEALRGVAPIRDKTRLAVSLGTYAGVLLVNLQCDPRYYTRHEAEQLADLFAERIRRRSGCDDSVAGGCEASRAA